MRDSVRQMTHSQLSARCYSSQMLGTDYGLRSAPTIATEIKHFSVDRLCQT
jgi:hypothetical protein